MIRLSNRSGNIFIFENLQRITWEKLKRREFNGNGGRKNGEWGKFGHPKGESKRHGSQFQFPPEVEHGPPRLILLNLPHDCRLQTFFVRAAFP